MYASIGSNSSSALSDLAELYSQFFIPSSAVEAAQSVAASPGIGNPLRPVPCRGVTTHLSAPKNNTDWTTYLNKNPDTRGLFPSVLKIPYMLRQTVRAFSSFCTTVRHSPSTANRTLPRYFKDRTISRGRSYALNVLEVTSLASYAVNRRCLRSSPFLHCAMLFCDPLKDRHNTSMLHRGHCGWGRLPSPSITMVSCTCQFHKCTLMVIHVAARPLQTSTGQCLGPAFIGNTIL